LGKEATTFDGKDNLGEEHVLFSCILALCGSIRKVQEILERIVGEKTVKRLKQYPAVALMGRF